MLITYICAVLAYKLFRVVFGVCGKETGLGRGGYTKEKNEEKEAGEVMGGHKVEVGI